MSRFNKKLSQLEAIYQVAPPVFKSETPENIYNALIEAFQTDTTLGKDWFDNACHNNISSASAYISSIFENKDTLISKKSILEGIQHYKEYKNGEAKINL